jgi:hypothetical protein
MQGMGVHSGWQYYVAARAGNWIRSILVHAYLAVGRRLEKISRLYNCPTR